MADTEKKIDRNFILGIKKRMTQIFADNGEAIPVTIVFAGPCQIVQVKKMDKEGYSAVQIGFGKVGKLNKALTGHLKGLGNFKYLREFEVTNEAVADMVRGKEIRVNSFTVGEKVKVVGTGKGKGFQGVVKRHGFSGGPASHGHKDQLRMPGSIGATDAARVFKGTRMGGRMGGGQVTVSNLEIVKIDESSNLLYLRGAVPGPRGGLLKILGNGSLKLLSVEVIDKDKEAISAESNNKVDQESEPTKDVNKEVVSGDKKEKISDTAGLKEKESERKEKDTKEK